MIVYEEIQNERRYFILTVDQARKVRFTSQASLKSTKMVKKSELNIMILHVSLDQKNLLMRERSQMSERFQVGT